MARPTKSAESPLVKDLAWVKAHEPPRRQRPASARAFGGKAARIPSPDAACSSAGASSPMLFNPAAPPRQLKARGPRRPRQRSVVGSGLGLDASATAGQDLYHGGAGKEGAAGLGPGCRNSCCWKWFTAMLVQELQVLKKTNIDAKQALESHLKDASLVREALAQDPEVAAALVEMHKKVLAEWNSFKDEAPRLQKENEDMLEEISRRQREVREDRIEVAALESELRTKQEHTTLLEDRRSELEEENNRLAISKASLSGQLQETEQLIERLQTEAEAAKNALLYLEMTKHSLTPKKRGGKGGKGKKK